jgi:acetyl esterase
VALYLDPDLARVVPALPATDISDPAAARQRLAEQRAARPPAPLPADVETQWLEVPGAEPVRVLVVRARPASTAAPGIVYFHGGGFVMGDVLGDQVLAAQLATAVRGVVLSVEYRLAPEHPFPAAHEDGYAVLSYLATHYAEVGVAPDRIAVAGSSAGAAIAAGLALRWRDEAAEHRPRLAAQLLEIPVVDDRAETPSAHYTDTPLWNRTNILDSWSHYLAGRDAATPVSPYAAPARAASLAGLPPSYVGVCTADPLRDEGIEYARRLAHDGVAVELRTYPGLFHGAAGLFPDVPACRRARAALLDAATRLLVS